MNIKNIRIGHGIDIHKFTTHKQLRLGGIAIPYKFGLLGHSDSDVLLHSIIDSILGALNMDDIGTWFPKIDKYKNADSSELLKEILDKTNYITNWGLINIDSTIILDEPVIMTKYSEQIKLKIANIINVKKNIVSLKAKTTEGIFYNNHAGIIALTTSLILIK